jgi:hypothetical protein
MTQSLYEAVLIVSKLQKHYPAAINLIILTRDQSQYSIVNSAITIKLQAEHDRSTNEATKYAILKLNDLPSKTIETKLTQTAVMELVNASKDGCTIFGIILPSSTELRLELTYSTNFDDVRIIMDLQAQDLARFKPSQKETLPFLQTPNLPVKHIDEHLSSLSLSTEPKLIITNPQISTNLFERITNDFQSHIQQNSKLETELSHLLNDPDQLPKSRSLITRPLAENWFILFSKLSLPKMESWITPVDQTFVTNCKLKMFSSFKPFELTIQQLIALAVNFNYKDSSLGILEIVLGLHTQMEQITIQLNEPHQCSFLVSCPFSYINGSSLQDGQIFESFYRYYLRIVALQIYSKYNTNLQQQLALTTLALP